MRKFGPKKKEHPTVGQKCQACGLSFSEGDYTTLITLGPGDNQENQEKCRQGQAYNAVAVEVHWDCATGGGKKIMVEFNFKVPKKCRCSKHINATKSGIHTCPNCGSKVKYSIWIAEDKQTDWLPGFFEALGKS